jgi:3-dehydroshikimate dehydratase
MTLPGGLCSVTLRRLSVPEVLDVMVQAGLGYVEWGGDIHVRPGDVATAARARAAGLDLGVRVASYGSYWRPGRDDEDGFADVLACAVALGAPRIRIWAGEVGSAAATAERRVAVIRTTRQAAARAADVGVELGFEYHDGTLTDTAEATVGLLQDIDRDNVRTYWQPPVGQSDTDAVRALDLVAPWLAAVHVYSWWPGEQRLALDARTELWQRVFRTARGVDAMLEFVTDDDPAHVVRDAATLRRLLDEAG